jgi:hypothetical protein
MVWSFCAVRMRAVWYVGRDAEAPDNAGRGRVA